MNERINDEISEIEKIKYPISRKKMKKKEIRYELPGFKYKNSSLLTMHLRRGVFVRLVKSPETIKVKAEDEINSYLKELFLTQLNLRERTVQQAFAINLMKYNRNWTLVMEEKLESGRPDVIFRDNEGYTIVVEIGREKGEDAVKQLKKYIEELKAKYEKIRGIIICSERTPELQAKASKEQFEIMDYSISIDFPSK